MKKIIISLFVFCAAIAAVPVARAADSAVELYPPECHDTYFDCMNQFCTGTNTDAGTCACSDDNAGYEKTLADIAEKIKNADQLKTVEVEKIQAGANADIIFNGERKYDENGNVIQDIQTTPEEDKKAATDAMLSLWNTPTEMLDPFADATATDSDSIANKTGEALRAAASDMCAARFPTNCDDADKTMIVQLYRTQIKNDCATYGTTITKQQNDATQALADAQKAVRDAVNDSFNAANKYDRGECLLNFEDCMKGDDVCGSDWGKCASSIASENMQNNAAKSTAGTTVSHTEKFDIDDSTLEMLDSKKIMCERVLDQCMAVRDSVWTDFLRDIAPEMHLAELNLESNMRQSCMTDISNCITKACNDPTIDTDGTGNINACLDKNGDVARSMCKVQIDPCERMEPDIWTYVVARLRATAVDVCTDEVKQCFTDPGRCGTDFSNCIGMDYNYMHDLCPLDSLTVCQRNYAQNGEEFTMDDLDNMLMGFYLNVDNAALENCQNLVDAKMTEICGSTTDCNKFAADDTMGTGSLNSTKIGGVYTITGMMSLGMIKMGTGTNTVIDPETGEPYANDAGRLDLTDYFTQLGKLGVPDEYGRIIDSIYFEMQNIQGNVNRVIDMISADPEIQYCINGRDLSQIKSDGGKTTARFPNLLNQLKMEIALSALRQAQNNYNKKYNDIMETASKNADTDMAELMCNKLPFANGAALGTSAADFTDSTVAVPYAIAIQIPGVSDAALAAGGTHASQTLGKTISDTSQGMAAGGSDGGAVSTIAGLGAGVSVASDIVKQGASLFSGASQAMESVVKMNPVGTIADAAVKALGILGSSQQHVEFDGGTTDMYSIFTRETRNCHFCTHTIIKDCNTTGSRGFLGLWDSRGVKCKSDDKGEQCQDIPM